MKNKFKLFYRETDRQDNRQNNRKIMISMVACALAAMASVSVTTAEDNSAAIQTIETRQKGFEALGEAFKLIRDELKDDAELAKIRTATADIEKAAADILKWFPAGTGPEVGVKTEAKPDIWSDAAGFGKAREAFVREASNFARIANAGDTAALNEATRTLGQACKGCHDKYRVKKKD